jgi:hypothetical protein
MLCVHFSNSKRRFIRRNRRAVDSSSSDGGAVAAAVDILMVVGIDINDGMIGAWEDKGRVGVMTVIFILKPLSAPIIIPLKSESIF